MIPRKVTSDKLDSPAAEAPFCLSPEPQRSGRAFAEHKRRRDSLSALAGRRMQDSYSLTVWTPKRFSALRRRMATIDLTINDDNKARKEKVLAITSQRGETTGSGVALLLAFISNAPLPR